MPATESRFRPAPPPPLHPAVARQAALADWTADPAIAALFAMVRDLNAVSARLETLHADRPDLGVEDVRGEVGEVASLYERCPGAGFGHGWRTRANGGACAALWETLDRRRTAWIDARLEAEGFRAASWSDARDERAAALADAALSVEAAWRRFRGSDAGATIPGGHDSGTAIPGARGTAPVPA